MLILSVYIKGILEEIEINPQAILEFYEGLTKYEIQSTLVFVEIGGFFKFLDPTGVISRPISYPHTGIKCEIETGRNGRNSLHIPLPNLTQHSIMDSIDTFLQTLGVKEYHITFENLGFE